MGSRFGVLVTGLAGGLVVILFGRSSCLGVLGVTGSTGAGVSGGVAVAITSLTCLWAINLYVLSFLTSKK